VTDLVVISGIGAIGPDGTGQEAVLQAYPGSPGASPALRVPDFSLEERLSGGRAFRRVSGATKFALAAMACAVEDARFSPETFGGERAGLIVTITHGGAPYSVQFHREMLLDGATGASPLHFSESVPNAPAGNGAIAFHVRGPVHTLIGEEPVGAQAVALAAGLLRAGAVERCLVAGTEERSEVVSHAYAQIDRARRMGRPQEAVPPFGEGAVALVMELATTAASRGVTPRAVMAGWRLDRYPTDRMAEGTADVVRGAFAATRHAPDAADHILPPLGRFRQAAVQGCLAARGPTAAAPAWVDLAPAVGNPAGASALFQIAASAWLLAAGKADGPGLVVSTGVVGTLSAVVLSHGERMSA
jgi:3-oxoacyl-[acyl-carrier-protein] synthase II